ncbi:MAG: hypothetical protein ACI8XO_003426 [Verrucomicrobiales bacterium]|jgi:hypothetical protein
MVLMDYRLLAEECNGIPGEKLLLEQGALLA